MSIRSSIRSSNRYLRINRPIVRKLSLQPNPGGSSNFCNVPIIALNGCIIDTESIEKDDIKPLSEYSRTVFDKDTECSMEYDQKKGQFNAQLKISSSDYFKVKFSI